MKRIVVLFALVLAYGGISAQQVSLEELKTQLTTVENKITNLTNQKEGLVKRIASLETEGWTHGGSAGITLANTGFDNWVQGGGDNSLALNFNLALFANFKRDKILWENNGLLNLGYLKTGDRAIRKADDRLYLFSKIGYQLNKKLYASVFTDFESQFAKTFSYDDELAEDDPGHKTLTSSFFAPAKIRLGVGIDYKPLSWITVYFSPLTYKGTFVTNDNVDETQFGLDPGATSRSELGAFARVGALRKVNENITVTSSLELYQNYLEKSVKQETGEEVGFPESVDVLWNTIIAFQFNKYIKADVDFTLKYDVDETSDLQFRNFIGVGLTYQF